MLLRFSVRGLWSKAVIGLAALVDATLAGPAMAQQIGDVFYIAMENKDFTEPGGIGTNPDQIFQNPAASFENSLVTPGNPNSVDVSYASNYTNSGTNVHPSEPNYIWSEAGTNYNPSTNTVVASDAAPSANAGNIFTGTSHLTGLLNAFTIPWKNYQEDYQVSGQGPLVSASGLLPSGQTNAYNGSAQYNYAVDHNPMAFFSDTATQNVAPLSQLNSDLANNTVGRYNWITPDQYNNGHSSLLGGFTYHGTQYFGESAEIAQGDNFLSMIVPMIESSAAFQHNGAIVIWYDETEGGDTTSQTLPEIVISPLAKGNAYDSTVPLNHSSDLKTVQEVLGAGSAYLNNPIPAAEYSPAGGPGTVNSVLASNDLSDLFQPGAIPTWIAGDANHDGIVNGQDIAMVASHWLQAGKAFPGDANGDGIVNGQDVALIAAHWLNTSGAGIGSRPSVPEPSMLVLAALGGLALLAWRRPSPWNRGNNLIRARPCRAWQLHRFFFPTTAVMSTAAQGPCPSRRSHSPAW